MYVHQWYTHTANAVSFTALPRQLLSPSLRQSQHSFTSGGVPHQRDHRWRSPTLGTPPRTPYCILATYLRRSFPRTEMVAYSTKEGSWSSVTARSVVWVVVWRLFQNSLFTSPPGNRAKRGSQLVWISFFFRRHEEQFWVAESFPSETWTGARDLPRLTSPSDQTRCNKKMNHEC